MKPNELKYHNRMYLKPVIEKEPDFAECIIHLHNAICLADDIADRAIHPTCAKDMLMAILEGCLILMKYPSRFDTIFKTLAGIYESEVLNHEFVPGNRTVAEEIEIWAKRAALLDLYFQAWACVDSSIYTEENIDWFENFKTYTLIVDDCKDLKTEEFEDLRQCRRNYVIMQTFGIEGYTDWEGRKEKMIAAADDVLNRIRLKKPSDPRMEIFTEGIVLCQDQQEKSSDQ